MEMKIGLTCLAMMSLIGVVYVANGAGPVTPPSPKPSPSPSASPIASFSGPVAPLPIANCTVITEDGTQEISIEKAPKAGEENLKLLFERDDLQYVFAENLNGSADFGIGQGSYDHAHRMVTFNFWTRGKLPLSFLDMENAVSIHCK
jgi:hypothetical protein